MTEMRILPVKNSAGVIDSGAHAAVRLLPDGTVEMVSGKGEVVWRNGDATPERLGVVSTSQAGLSAECPEAKHQLWCGQCDWDPSWWELAAYAVREGIRDWWSSLESRFTRRQRMDGGRHGGARLHNDGHWTNSHSSEGAGSRSSGRGTELTREYKDAIRTEQWTSSDADWINGGGGGGNGNV